MIIKQSEEMNYMKFFGVIYLLFWHTGIIHFNIFVITFFLQMFFFISGYFYKDTDSEKPFVFLRKRIISLYVPYIKYCLLFLVLNNLFVRLNIYKDTMSIEHIKFVSHFFNILKLNSNLLMGGAMWFVATLFFASILFCCISVAVKKLSFFNICQTKNESIRFFIVAAFFLFGNYLSFIKVTLPSLLDVSFVLLIFYYLGYLYKKYEKKIPLNIFFASSSFLTIFVCTKFGFPLIVSRQYIDPSFILVCGIAGIYLNLYIAKKCAVFKNPAFINYVGKNTLVILAMHYLAFKLVSIIVIYSQNLPISFLSSYPVIESTSQAYRWLYVISGLLIPLSGKYLFDMGYCKLKTFLTLKLRIKRSI